MKKLKTYFLGGVFLLAAGITISANANSTTQDITCSSLPDGDGIVKTPKQFGCTSGEVLCCYRIPDNYMYTKSN